MERLLGDVEFTPEAGFVDELLLLLVGRLELLELLELRELLELLELLELRELLELLELLELREPEPDDDPPLLANASLLISNWATELRLGS